MFIFNRFSRTLIIISMLLFVPVSSYALVDLSVYGGYSFAGELKNGESSDVDGWQYGLYGHINTGIPMILTAGVGGFLQRAPLNVEESGGDVDATKETVGLDAYAQLILPVLPVQPYVRYGIGIREKVKYSGSQDDSSEYFKSHYFGFGISRTVLTAAVINLQIFAEYIFTTSKQDDDSKLKGNAINVGIKADL